MIKIFNNLIKSVCVFILCFSTLHVAAFAGGIAAKRNVLTIYDTSSPTSLDRIFTNDIPSLDIIRNLFEGLVERDQKGEMVPGVAESWTNKDNKIWTFKLRKNAKWSDGKSVTAHDFVYAFRRLADPKTASPLASELLEMGCKNADDVIKGKLPVEELGVKALDDYTVEFTLDKPIAYFLEVVEYPPLRKDLIEKYGDKWTAVENLVVNGPYKLEELVLQEKTVLVKNPHYWNKDNIAIDKAVTLVIADPNTAYNRFLAGELDVVGVGAPKPLYERAKREYGDKVLRFPRLSIFYLGIDFDKIPDVRVRKALQLGIDRDIITDKVLGSGQVPAYNFVPPNLKNGNYPQPEWANWTKQQRHKEAKRLLAEAGYNEKNPYKFKLSYSTGEVATTIAVALQSMYKRNIGVNVSLENMEWKTFLQEREAGNLETWFIGGSAGFNDASTFLVPYVSDASYNVAK